MLVEFLPVATSNVRTVASHEISDRRDKAWGYFFFRKHQQDGKLRPGLTRLSKLKRDTPDAGLARLSKPLENARFPDVRRSSGLVPARGSRVSVPGEI